mgnify:FL=1
MMTRTDDRTVVAATGWAESVAGIMRAYADDLDRLAREVRADLVEYAPGEWGPWQPEEAGRYVAAMIRSWSAAVAGHAYDYQACEVCGVPGQWHEDNGHYPQG